MADLRIAVPVLRRLFAYDQCTGELVRRVPTTPKTRAGDCIRRPGANGYISVSVANGKVLLHRMVWAMHYGSWPTGQIDHVNGDRLDNRIANLRDVGLEVNAQNLRRAKASNRTTGVLGVTYDGRSKRRKRYKAQIVANGVRRFLGRYLTLEEARQVYLSAKRRLHQGCTI